MIPCLYDVTRRASTPPGGPERWQLETQLVRDRNQVSDALVDAPLLIETSLSMLP